MALGQSGRALERLLGGLQRTVGGLGEVLGVMLARRWQLIHKKPKKKCGSKRQAIPEWFFDGFLIEDKQPGRPKVCI